MRSVAVGGYLPVVVWIGPSDVPTWPADWARRYSQRWSQADLFSATRQRAELKLSGRSTTGLRGPDFISGRATRDRPDPFGIHNSAPATSAAPRQRSDFAQACTAVTRRHSYSSPRPLRRCRP